VLLAAAGRASATLLTALPYTDQVDYIRPRLAGLVGNPNGFFSAADIDTFEALFQQHGGWWRNAPSSPGRGTTDILNQSVAAPAALPLATDEFYLVPFVSPTLAEAGANKPWLQELPDPTTTVMWNSWVEINPQTAQALGIDNDDVVLVLSDFGALKAPVYLYPAIRPDVIAIPFGQGHTAYGRYSAGRGVNPAMLLAPQLNAAGDLAFGSTKVRISKTGERQFLARLESRIGVYGEGLEES
jgi:formylmethanofuran dehydrogenase subunit D